MHEKETNEIWFQISFCYVKKIDKMICVCLDLKDESRKLFIWDIQDSSMDFAWK